MLKGLKGNVLITGKPGVGKTTLVKRLVEEFNRTGKAGGFYTEEIAGPKGRTGFKIITMDGKEGILAKKGMRSPYRLGKYGINIRDLDEIGVAAVEIVIAAEDIDLIVIDEIGKMELFSQRFKEMVLEALDCKKPVLGVIQMTNIPFLDHIKKRRDVEMHHLTIHNRETLFKVIQQYSD